MAKAPNNQHMGMNKRRNSLHLTGIIQKNTAVLHIFQQVQTQIQ